MNAKLLIVVAMVLPVTAQETTWQERMESARMLVRSGKSTDARAIAEAVRENTLAVKNHEGALAADRMLIFFARTAGEWPRVEELLNELMDVLPRPDATAMQFNNAEGKAYYSQLADLMTELAQARRAQGKLEAAVATLERGVTYRGRLPLAAEAARDFTSAGLIQLELKKVDDAKSWLLGAVQMWGQLMREDPEVLSAVEAMAGLYRDDADYASAEPLYERALRIREIYFGPKSAEVIGGLDNLAYCYFGSKKYDKAEPLYKRLLEIWDETAGPDHPMIALTLDKMVTFYVAQEKFEEARPLADRAIQIRGKSLSESFKTRAVLAARQQQGQAAVDFTTKALQTAGLAGLPKPPVKILPAPKNAVPLIKGKPAKSVPNPK